MRKVNKEPTFSSKIFSGEATFELSG